MTLDPVAQHMLEQKKAMNAPKVFELTPEQARQPMDLTETAGEPEEVGKVEDVLIPGPLGDIPIRVYTPKGEGDFPAFIYYHGGGWTIGSIDSVDVPCRLITNRSDSIVIAVEYRLAPEHKFPAPLNDAYATAKWVAEHGKSIGVDTTRIAVGGDSAGGNLAAAVTLMAKDIGNPKLSYQVLVYPNTNYAFDTATHEEFGEGYLLTNKELKWFWDHYLNNAEDGKNPYVSPLIAEDLSGLPPALVITAEYDQLRVEGEGYGERLKEAGVPVKISRYDEMLHGFYWMPKLYKQGMEAIEETANSLKEAFSNRIKNS
ncbi:alpha/beta hydrolase [Neobacillus novalis]|uniref:Alpha/beta hydrolase n=1 Tax=Neobacillus novalis TaxID=220687 RepID=A0AA95ML82_9BACI|nr:alpha/beta hydrolase [Neobacillus novalis]WHY83950.1 alpha/beta hydrolase [Neobacillus novalis]